MSGSQHRVQSVGDALPVNKRSQIGAHHWLSSCVKDVDDPSAVNICSWNMTPKQDSHSMISQSLHYNKVTFKVTKKSFVVLDSVSSQYSTWS